MQTRIFLIRGVAALDPLMLYAAAGGAFFVIQAWMLRRRLRRAGAAPTVITSQLEGTNA
ncbi:hypothetical protein [Arthrobacter sp. NPDC057013]|uniref:hypothetical protein n=1 Tax=Arthrobacter sp. NPDC057013 TaxID=3345999 RepID=UPI0036315032